MRIAHRNGLLRAHAEQSINQPTVGSAHSAYTGIIATKLAATFSGLARSPNEGVGISVIEECNDADQQQMTKHACDGGAHCQTAPLPAH